MTQYFRGTDCTVLYSIPVVYAALNCTVLYSIHCSTLCSTVQYAVCLQSLFCSSWHSPFRFPSSISYCITYTYSYKLITVQYKIRVQYLILSIIEYFVSTNQLLVVVYQNMICEFCLILKFCNKLTKLFLIQYDPFLICYFL